MQRQDHKKNQSAANRQETGFRPQRIAGRFASLCLVSFALCLLAMIFSCASAPKLPAPPPRYIYQSSPAEEVKSPVPGNNSLWRDTASLYEDIKARRLNDLITINVVENISGSGTADTSAGRTSTADMGISSLLGIPSNLNMVSAYGKGNTFSPNVKGSMTDAFKGSGATTRAGTLIGTITAKVVEVMPNGSLAIESRKEITINNEKQILILRGMVRPDDVAIDNSILSNKVADAEVFFVGDGVVQSKQDTGWLVKILDKVWPF